MARSMAVDEILVGVGGGALSSYAIAAAAGVPMAAAAPVGFLVGGLIYGFYKASKGSPNPPGLTADQVNQDLMASGAVAALAYLIPKFGLKEQVSQALIHAATAATGGTAVAAMASANPLAGIIAGLAGFITLTAMIFGTVFVIGDKFAEWLAKKR